MIARETAQATAASGGGVTLDRDGDLAILTLDRPAKLNALTLQMLRDLADRSAELDADPGVRAIVLTGAGDRAFSAGGDLTELLPKLTEPGGDRLLSPDPGERFFSRVYTPVIAAVNGLCVAGGLELMLGTDIRVASADAVFGLAEVKWGIVPGAGSHIRLPRQIPWAIAMEILLTGEPISAERAREVGLVNQVVAAGSALDAALAFARRIAANGPVAVRTAKRIAVDSLDLSAGFQLEAEHTRSVLDSEDIREGLAAFAEGRSPRFNGR